MDNTFSKEELISLHDLGEKVSKEEDFETPNHDEVGVSPIQIHKTNKEHKEGMMAVFDDIYNNILEEREE